MESFWASAPGRTGVTGMAGVAIATAAQVEDGIITGLPIAAAAAGLAAAGPAVIRMGAGDLAGNPTAAADRAGNLTAVADLAAAVSLTAVAGLAAAGHTVAGHTVAGNHMAAAATARTNG